MNLYYNPVRTIQGAGAIQELPDILAEMKLEKGTVLFLVWSEDVLSAELLSQLQQPALNLQIKTIVFEASNPTVEQLFAVYQQTRAFAPEVVVAIGGGSIMDVGKSLCCLYGKEISNTDKLRELIEEKNYGQPQVRWIGVPTTAGTGSEVTCWATIWDPIKNAKRSVESQANYAYAAIVDSALTEGLPLKLAVTSALDAVAHGVESYWANGTNCVSRALALQGIRLIMENMDLLILGEPSAHEYLAQGSMLTGLAFSNTKTTAGHSISYPLTMHHGIPHGAAVSMLLAPVLELNGPKVKGLSELLAALGVKDAKSLKKRINNFLKESDQPTSLVEWGVLPAYLSPLAELGMTKGRADNNPVEITTENIKEILNAIYFVEDN